MNIATHEAFDRPESSLLLEQLSGLQQDEPMEFLVVLVPGFSQLCLSSFIEPLRIANNVSGRRLFNWRLVSPDGEPVSCASGIAIGVNGSLRQEVENLAGTYRLHATVICAGEAVEKYDGKSFAPFLRRCANRRMLLVGLGTGTWILAAAGFLNDSVCTIHWDKMAALSETFRELAVSDALFLADRNIITCAGGLASFDLAATLVERCGGLAVAQSMCRVLTAERWRSGESSQTIPIDLRYSGASRKLVQIIRLMERVGGEPVSLQQIARQAGVSRRQMERLFRYHLGTTPLKHFMTVRLMRARQLLQSTNLSVLDVAIACGFVTSSHFSRCFRNEFGMLPSTIRSRRAKSPNERLY